jgi:serine protease inhibitor
MVNISYETASQQESSGNVTLEFANAAFLKEGFEINAQFENILEQDFQSTIKPTDFNNPPAAADEINSWVANKTHDKIQNLVSPGKETSHFLVKCTSLYHCTVLHYVQI